MDSFNSDLIERLKTLKKHRRLILYVLISSFVLVTIYNIFCERLFKSQTTIISIQSSKGDLFSYLSGQSILGSLGNLFPGFNVTSEKLLNVLKSRTVTEEVISKLNLMPLIFKSDWDKKNKRWKDPQNPPFMEVAVKIMQEDIAEIKDSRDGLILVTALWPDPIMAQAIASQYITELANFLYENSLSMGKKNRVFLEEQLEKNMKELAQAENTLKEFQEKHKMIDISAQAEMTIKTIANLKAEIINRDYQLGFLKNTTGLNTAQASKIKQEKAELEKQLKIIESGETEPSNQVRSKTLVTVKDFPSLQVEFLRLKREFLILEKVFELLTTQYELAKIEEVRDQITFQVIDEAKVPMKKYKPRIILNTVIAMFAGMLLSLIAIVTIESVDWRRVKEEL